MRFIMAGFGVLWTILAISLTSSGPSDGPFLVARYVFPGFGILFIIAAFGIGGVFDSALKSVLKQKSNVGEADVQDEEAATRRGHNMKCSSCGAVSVMARRSHRTATCAATIAGSGSMSMRERPKVVERSRGT